MTQHSTLARVHDACQKREILNVGLYEMMYEGIKRSSGHAMPKERHHDWKKQDQCHGLDEENCQGDCEGPLRCSAVIPLSLLLVCLDHALALVGILAHKR